jgi:hypothetical protein
MNKSSKIIQDSTQQRDTAKVIKALKIVPATKIESSDGAIIPKEAVAWMELQPALPVEKEKDSMLSTYILIGAVVIGVFILVKVLSNRRSQKRSV